MTSQVEKNHKISESSGSHFLDDFFYPNTVAVVGATSNKMKINYHLLENNVRLNFRGRIIPINPHSEEIAGVRVYKRLKDVPEKIDLVVLSIPASRCPGIIRECIELGVKGLVIISGGFSEGGAEGEKRNEETKKLIRESSLRVIGPNTLSPINADNNFAISFHHINEFTRGDVSFVFQSGMYEYKLNWINSHIGINKVLDLGNKIDVNEVDALEYLGSDPATKVIAMHIESFRGDGRMFMEILKKTTAKKPVIILKSGRTPAGSIAAASHTGSMAGDNDAILDSMIRQSGGIRANNLEDFFDLAKTFAFLAPPENNRVAIITLSGGEGVIATDACEMHGLEMAELSPESYSLLKEIFPPWEIPLNPFDSGVSMEFHTDDFQNAFRKLAVISNDKGVDCVIMQLPATILNKVVEYMNNSEEALAQMMDFLVEFFLEVKKTGKPFSLWRSSLDELETALVKKIESHSIPVYQSQERAARATAALYTYKRYRNRN